MCLTGFGPLGFNAKDPGMLSKCESIGQSPRLWRGDPGVGKKVGS